jgi:hypothetical protein
VSFGLAADHKHIKASKGAEGVLHRAIRRRASAGPTCVFDVFDRLRSGRFGQIQMPQTPDRQTPPIRFEVLKGRFSDLPPSLAHAMNLLLSGVFLLKISKICIKLYHFF